MEKNKIKNLAELNSIWYYKHDYAVKFCFPQRVKKATAHEFMIYTAG
jgi:hypothetical protein